MGDRQASVLVVDDTPENLRLLCGILTEQGYEVRPVTSGRHALTAAEHSPPDLILRDVCEPLQRLRAVEIRDCITAPLQADPQLLSRVLENLISNSIKHTPNDCPIWVSSSTDEKTVRISVHDEGPGVPLEARERIFEKFGTVAARNEQSYHSVGMGLAFCKLAVQAHGGRIGLDVGSERGCIFWFELPR